MAMWLGVNLTLTVKRQFSRVVNQRRHIFLLNDFHTLFAKAEPVVLLKQGYSTVVSVV